MIITAPSFTTLTPRFLLAGLGFVICALVMHSTAHGHGMNGGSWKFIPGPETNGLVGVSAGVTNDAKGFAGAELSLYKGFAGDELAYYGLYADALYDFGQHDAFISVGPEVGFAYVGLDFGPAYRVAENELGYYLRPMLSVGILGAYARLTHFPGGEGVGGQFGLVAKVPLSIF